MGDVFSSAGCEFLLKELPEIRKKENIDFTVVNGENSAVGNGITKQSADIIFAAGADVITGGNHSLRQKEIYETLDTVPYILRPHNLSFEYGSGYYVCDTGRYRVAVINLMGSMLTSSEKLENPFVTADKLITRANEDGADFILVDFHAEATSEKRAMGIYLDGRITALFGTHTHIPTADAQIPKNGTGYITDLGMTGVQDSVLGVKSEIIINRFLKNDMSRFEAASGRCVLCGCVFDADKNGCNFVKQIIREED